MAVKDGKTFQASASVPAGQTLPADATSGWVDLRKTNGTLIVGKVTNGATGPTQPAEFAVEVSRNATAPDGELFRAAAKGDNNAVSSFPVRVPPEVMYARSVFYGGSDQAVTVEAQGQTLKAVV